MASTIFTAPEYDARREHRRKVGVILAILAILLAAGIIYLVRNWPQEHEVKQFLTALEQQNFEKAYTIWLNDPAWKQHPQKYSSYTYNDFYQDWGPGGKYGTIHSFKVDGSARPGNNGVVVQVTINDRKEPEQLWVGKDSTITVWPYQ